MTKSAVVVGAGAVGAVYGRHIKRAGTELTFLVKPKHAEAVRAGIRLYRGKSDELFVPDDVVTEVDALRGRSVQQVWLCVPSTGLDEAGLAALAEATGDALVVDLMPDLAHRSLAVVGRERLVDGLIPFIAWQTPLPGDDDARPPGIAYWLPPFLPTQLSGPGARRAASVLRRGGMSARVVDDVARSRAVGSALLLGVIATLEASGWDLAACRARLDGATREAVLAMAHDAGASASLPALLARPALLRLVLRLAPRLLPLPLERYLRWHFTKVGPQMRETMTGCLAAADRAGLAAPDLRALAAALPRLPPLPGGA